jgi:predicted alpha/beta-fold hydrolase
MLKFGIPPFIPLPFARSGHAQTIYAHFLPQLPDRLKNRMHTVELNDGDKLLLIENTPEILRKSARIILLVHGLSGSSQSKYLVRLARLLVQEGYTVFRVNLRGCGKGKNLAKEIYHSGRSEDLRAVLEWLNLHYPNQPVTQIGFSLGANITLKMAGETAPLSRNLDSIGAISPPLDLYQSVKLIIHPINKRINQFFTRALIKATPTLEMPINNLYEFDDAYTAPRAGYKNALDYYNQCSSKLFIDNVTLPTLLLYALDDPVITRRPFYKIENNKIDCIVTRQGGHVGWLGYTEPRFKFRWMDQALIKWINWIDKR